MCAALIFDEFSSDERVIESEKPAPPSFEAETTEAVSRVLLSFQGVCNP